MFRPRAGFGAGSVCETVNVNHVPGGGGPGPEGGDCWNADPCFGLSGYSMPIDSFIGVFLADTTNLGGAPPDLDFCNDAARDFDTFSPELYQVFFIGHGLRNDGVTQQRFVVPAGATRLYLASGDAFCWFNNSGNFTFTIESHPTMGVSNLIAGQSATISIEGATPNGTVGIAYSLTGSGPTNVNVPGCGVISVGLSQPITVLGLFTADGSGAVTHTQTLPANASGASVWVQGFDVATCLETNLVAETIG